MKSNDKFLIKLSRFRYDGKKGTLVARNNQHALHYELTDEELLLIRDTPGEKETVIDSISGHVKDMLRKAIEESLEERAEQAKKENYEI